MKAVVVGYGAMGKIISSMLEDEFLLPVSIECEHKSLDDVKEDFDVIIDFQCDEKSSYYIEEKFCYVFEFV